MTVGGNTLTPHQEAVYRTMRDWRRPITDAALVPLVQHVAQERVSSSGVRTRRAELYAMGLLTEVPAAAVKMPSGRRAHAYAVSKGR